PLLGRIMTGGKHRGVVAFAWSIRGSVDEPAITIHKMASLTPGILRELFRPSRREADFSQVENSE
ncbi:MAG: hypothetical protein V3T95_00975, partial [Acidobacteriota bacterium]